MTDIRIGLIDDHSLVRDGIARLLNNTDGFRVVGEAGSIAAGEKLLAEVAMDVVLLDVDLPDGSGIDLCARVGPSTRVLMLSASGHANLFTHAMENGAQGYLLKRADSEALVRAVKELVEGRIVVDPTLQSDLFTALRNDTTLPSPLDRCDERQLELLCYLADGRSTSEIAAEMFVSEGTTRNWISRLLRTIDARNRTEAALLASRHRAEIEHHIASMIG